MVLANFPPLASRRAVLLGAGAAFLSSCAAGRGFGASDPFALGVASGDPAPDGFVLWTRLALDPLRPDGGGGMGLAPVSVRWEIGANESLTHIVQAGEAIADPRLAHSVHVEASGLAPNRPYWYRFTAMGAQSPIGRARTAPAPDQSISTLRFGFASCAHYEAGYFSAYRRLAEEGCDAVFFLGDYIYEYSYRDESKIVRRHDRPDEIVDLAGYRNRYALHRLDPDLQALHAAAPAIVTWDDHEVENDYNALWSQNGTVSTHAFAARRRSAYQAFYEHMPLRRASLPTGDGLRLHRRLRFGDLADVTVLDGRQYRDIQPCPNGLSRRGHVAPVACFDALSPQRSLLGAAQEAWLYDSFREAKRARWGIVAQDLLVASFLQKAKDQSLGHYTDGWDGFDGNRRRMLEAVRTSGANNVVFFGGDIHSFWAADLKPNFRDPKSPVVATEFITSSITSDPPPHDVFQSVMDQNPHVRFFDARQRGYLRVDVSKDRMEARMQMISDRRDPKATLSTLKAFVVENGKPGAVAI